MPLLVLALALLIPLLVVVLTPIALIQRYRAGTARRQARPWLVAVNLVGLMISTTLFLTVAAMTTLWLPAALPASLAGLAGGVLLGGVGLALTRWEVTPTVVHYTPHRWLVLGITLVVSARLLYGLWRSWQAWQGAGDGAWLEAAGAEGSLAAGAVVLGYYLAYWSGVRRRVRRHMR